MFVLTRLGVFLFSLSAVACLFAAMAWRKRDEAGGTPVAVFLVVVAIGSAAYGFDIGYATLGPKYFWFRVSIVAQLFATAAWVVTGFEYAGRSEWVTRRSITALLSVPTVLSTYIFLPGTQEQVITFDSPASVGPISMMDFSPGPVMGLSLVYVILGIALASVLLFQLVTHARHLYKTQAVTVAIAATLPWSEFLLEAVGLFTEVQLSIPLITLSGIALTIGLYEFKTLDPVPTAHEAIVEKMGAGVVVIDEDGKISDVNPAAIDLLAPAAHRDDLIGTSIDEQFPDWSEIEYPRAGTSEWHDRSLTVDGETHYLEVQVAPFFDHHDELVGRLVHLRDVTAREERERALARFKRIFESVRDRVYVLDQDDRFAVVNDPFAALFGYDPDDLVGRPFSDILADDTAAVPPVAPSNERATTELSIETADGTVIPCETHRAPIEFEFGDLHGGSVGFIRDISRRKQIETDLAETTERYETLSDASPLAIVAFAADGTVEQWNPAAEEMFGWSREESVGDRLPFVPQEDRELLDEVLDRTLDGERIMDLEVTLQRRGGDRFDASLSVAPIADQVGETHGGVAVVADMTDRKDRERALKRKNERLDQFAAMVSHDLRNPLEVAQGNTELIAETGDLDRIENVSSALDRMSELIGDLLTLARQGQELDTVEPVDLVTTVEDAWDGVDTRNATLTIATDPGTVESDRVRLVELFENLFRNSIDHAGTDVTVRFGGLEDRRGFFVADDGPGIPAADREAVLDTGFTTADDGTGFGLSIVETIAQAHDWTITVTESWDDGARFEFEFGPDSAGGAESGDGPPAEPSSSEY